jgi:cyanophycinase
MHAVVASQRLPARALGTSGCRHTDTSASEETSMKRLLALLLILVACTPAWAAKKPPYTYFRVGSTSDVSPATTGGTVLMGGGTDVDAAFQWMCGLAGNGDFLVIRATGTDAYNPYIQQLCPLTNSVATLIIPSVAAANDVTVAAIMQNAEAIWIAGGDQSNYINFWTGTPVQAILNAKIANHVPVGGTSAGMNVLTQFIYSAQAPQGVTSSQALADPFNRYMSFARDFASVSNLVGIIGDPHFATRDRMGRDLAFLCRIAANGWSNAPRGVAVDEQTALLIDDGGVATVVGSSTAYFLQAPGLPQVCAAKTPLTYDNIAVQRIDASGTFDFNNWHATAATTYTVSADAGVLSSTQPGGSAY